MQEQVKDDITDYIDMVRYEVRPGESSDPMVDKHWYGGHQGDKDGGSMGEHVGFHVIHFIPGSILTVDVPLCPKCNGDPIYNETSKKYVCVDNCTFDWQRWIANEFGVPELIEEQDNS